jgi:hypothetical protein
MLIYLSLVSYIDGFDNVVRFNYVDCPIESLSPCLNPYYDSSCKMLNITCKDQFLERGAYIGHKPSKLYNNFATFAFIIFFSAIGLNHLIYNKKVKNENNN